jgi:hypothetical protein
MPMTETQALLGKIAALRQRLEQARGLVEDAGSAAVSLAEMTAERPDPVRALLGKITLGVQQQEWIDGSLLALPGSGRPGAQDPLPTHLTARARRLLPEVHGLLTRLRGLADEPHLSQGTDDPLAGLHRQMSALVELAVRVLQTLPETPSAQLRLCEGVEAVLATAANRVSALEQILELRRRERGQIARLGELLASLATGASPGAKPFQDLVETILEEGQQGMPLRFLQPAGPEPAESVACHALTVARVLARLVRHLPDWRGHPQRPVLAALLHDVGMLRVPADILASTTGLDEEQRRAVEAHPAAGAQLLGRLGDDVAWLKEAAANHHERLDGTGYPAGLNDLQISALVRLLAIADVYAAMCCGRRHRPALDTRTALTDTLLLAQQGGLDANYARSLLELTLYPVGTTVELADGAVGVVVATHPGCQDISACARPVLALLADGQGRALPLPHHVDLAVSQGRSIVRGLPAAERRQLLGTTYPEHA